ncbi:MAG: D-glycerate dehydrogenase [Flavihumibacter sp.]
MKIFISRIIPEAGRQLLLDAGHTLTEYAEKKPLPDQELIRICAAQDGFLSVGHSQLDETFFSQCARLRGVALMSAGHDQVDLNAATRWKIPVSNTPGVLSAATADTAFLLLLAVSRNAFYNYRRILNSDWGFFEPTAHLGIELYGKTLGIVGLGKIGADLAHKCKAVYNMKIVYHNRSASPFAGELDATYLPFNELLSASDVVSVHTDLNASTEGMFNAAAFGRMKPGAIFINTARGKIHDETALTAALQSGHLWGCGLDVTNPEPMRANNPLLTMPRVCILPHIGSATHETRNKMAVMAAENLLAALAGNKMPQVLNPEAYL